MQALEEYLEDCEDIYLAEKELENIKAGKSSLTSLEDFKRELFGWQIKEINKGIVEADAGLFASEEERQAMREEWSSQLLEN